MRKQQKNILIIKLGYCETLANEEGFIPSLGDVFRHTVILHHYAGKHITWLTSESARQLLEGNPLINELLTFDATNTPKELANREFDEVICFEKAPSICNLLRSIKAKDVMGFTWNGKKLVAHRLAKEALNIANGKSTNQPIQFHLYQMIGAQWKGEDYVLGYKPKTPTVVDIGLNYLVGSKWPTKAWPMKSWKKLESLCVAKGYSVSWQQGASDLRAYMDWIQSCHLVVTCDSLGMHLGRALHKLVVAMFGPTPSDQIFMYGRGSILRPDLECPKSPCLQMACTNSSYCMDYLFPEVVFYKITQLMNPHRKNNIPAPTRRLAPARSSEPMTQP